ncbi:MAG: histidine--tRNA ligase [Bacteroidales bacterium]|nr:histidine--tRNA ligase [Bacteroidales bacterium]MDE7072132.1 histidine--tRNA ligase [Bacteroidales bacterium]
MKPTTVKGTRDFDPLQMRRRQYIFDTISEVYRLHGYQPIETPAMENLSTLMGKYGEEGDKLLFKILNSGDFMGKTVEDLAFWPQLEGDTGVLGRRLLPKISEKGLRYDLTVPFARFVVQRQGALVFPFKRYQIQPVWRADRPQKGRYREFYQCDADVIGSDSLLNEAELVQMIAEVFDRFGIRVRVKINNRKVLFGIAQTIGHEDKMVDVTVAIDKWDKIGEEGVRKELTERGICPQAVEKLMPVLHLKGDTACKLSALESFLQNSETGKKGIEELKTLFALVEAMRVEVGCELDLTLARGLNYYTGAIFEVKAEDVEIGSICGGGRYDDLTGVFGLKGMSGVGISFGADRIYDVLNELNLYPERTQSGTQVLFVNFGEQEQTRAFGLASALRKENVSAEIYPSPVKLQKQFSYADNLHIPLVALLGENESRSGTVVLKDMEKGEQKTVVQTELTQTVKEMLGRFE